MILLSYLFRASVVFLAAFLVIAPAYAMQQIEWKYSTAGDVNSVAISGDGDYIGAVSNGKKVYFFNKSGELLWNGETQSIPFSVALSGDGNYTVAGDEFSVYLFNKSGSLIWNRYFGSEVGGVAISENGERIVSGIANGKIYLLKIDKSEVWAYDAKSPVLSVAISHDGEKIAAGTSDGFVYLINKDKEVIWTYETGRYVDDIDVFEETVIAGSRRVYFIEDGDEIWRYITKKDVLGVDISADGKNITASSEDGKIYSFSPAKKLLWTYDTGKAARDVAISKNGEYVIVGAGNEVYALVSIPSIAENYTVNITSPENGSTITGIVAINASVPSVFENIVVTIDGNYACGSLPCSWDTSASTLGKHNITVRAFNLDGNESKATIEVNVERRGIIPQIVGNESEAVTKAKERIETEAKRLKYALLIALLVIGIIAWKMRKRGGEEVYRYRWRG